MRPFGLLLWATALSMAQSHPSAWNYVAPEASAVVGINWRQLRISFLAEALEAEFYGSGRLGFPDLDCLRDAGEILLAGPDLLGVVSGRFQPSTVAAQAAHLGMKPAEYQGVRLWIAPGANRRSVAQVSDTLLLVGFRDTLEAAIDRNLPTTERQYSPLLARGAHLATIFDLWIAAAALPDPLVSVLLPVALESGDFDGGLIVRSGLVLDARYDMADQQDAALSAEYFRQAVPGFHALLRKMNVIEDGTSVRLKLHVTSDELAHHLRVPLPLTAETPQMPAVSRIVHVYGLDDGPREFTLPPLQH